MQLLGEGPQADSGQGPKASPKPLPTLSNVILRAVSKLPSLDGLHFQDASVAELRVVEKVFTG